MTRIIRNCHPAHLDRTEHRVAMGGCHGTLPPSSPQAAKRPSDSIHPSASKMPNSQLSAALRAKNTCGQHIPLLSMLPVSAVHSYPEVKQIE